MKRRTSHAFALGLLGLAVLGGIAAILYPRSQSVVQADTQEVLPAPSEAELDAEIARMITEIREEGRRSEEAIARRLDEESGSELWELGRTRLITFIGVASPGPDGKPKMTETWKGRVPSDFASYIEPVGPGPWLIGRFRKGSGPLEGWDGKHFPRVSLRFCYEITPDGEVVGVKPDGWVKLEELRKHLEGN